MGGREVKIMDTVDKKLIDHIITVWELMKLSVMIAFISYQTIIKREGSYDRRTARTKSK